MQVRWQGSNMRRQLLVLVGISAAIAVMAAAGRAAGGRSKGRAQLRRPGTRRRLQMSQATLDDMLIRFPLPAGQEAYADIDGKRMHTRRRRTGEHRPTVSRPGPSQVLGPDHRHVRRRGKRRHGCSPSSRRRLDRRAQLSRSTSSRSGFRSPGSVDVAGGGKTIVLDSAQPHYGTVGTPAAGLDLEAVYVGLGSEADFRAGT